MRSAPRPGRSEGRGLSEARTPRSWCRPPAGFFTRVPSTFSSQRTGPRPPSEGLTAFRSWRTPPLLV